MKLENDPRALREPDTKPSGDGFFELRTLGTDIARGIWVYQKGSVTPWPVT
uniref:Toxin HigB n=1 Tax=Klebsiella pneumoniae TaxID=573 RepID=A0A3G4RJE0_KLEPN|nr:Toxin HigB [Klebsiella pneumoniae]QIM13733.1 Toxin HigB [Klebsiella pneumoniae]